ncbi:MAG: hypothetical protein IBX57_00525 [Gammaproteobacteria bacterium]|nr:hypothetical protein [Gammaproteobacteria bacterium]
MSEEELDIIKRFFKGYVNNPNLYSSGIESLKIDFLGYSKDMANDFFKREVLTYLIFNGFVEKDGVSEQYIINKVDDVYKKYISLRTRFSLLQLSLSEQEKAVDVLRRKNKKLKKLNKKLKLKLKNK